jgi:AcrR family transcriptional regulator
MDYSKRQIQIIEAATLLIGQKGIQNLTTKNLAAEIGFSEPALYRHFENKTDILQSVLLYYRQLLKVGLEKILSEKTTGADKINRLIAFQFNHFTKHPAIVMVIFSETSFQYEENLSKTVLNLLTQKKVVMENLIKLGQEDKSIREDINSSQLADIIMGSMRFTILRWRLNNFNFNLINEGQELSIAISKILTCPKN